MQTPFRNSLMKSFTDMMKDSSTQFIINELFKLGDTPNIVLGGKWALFLHGLNVGDLSKSDIDIIIYHPNKTQLAFLDFLRESLPAGKHNLYFPIHKRRSFAVKLVNGTLLDFLVDRTSKMPNDLTFAMFANKLSLPVQSINNIMDARSVYKRTKDYENNMYIKNHNFNI